ncbi:hypothetical protein J3459_012057 [Metarhizium acridum]|nr:hypothetical protein J3459_012057 [Metarhizium acridum]
MLAANCVRLLKPLLLGISLPDPRRQRLCGQSRAHHIQCLSRHDDGDHYDGTEEERRSSRGKWAHQYMAPAKSAVGYHITKETDTCPTYSRLPSGRRRDVWNWRPSPTHAARSTTDKDPKFVSHSWAPVTHHCDTAYPFEDTLVYRIDAKGEFDLYLRVPGWATGYTITAVSPSGVPPPTLAPARACKRFRSRREAPRSGSPLALPSVPRRVPATASPSFSATCCNALDVGYSNTTSFPHAYGNTKGPGLDYLPYRELRDYYIKNTHPWNVAIDPSTLKYSDARNKGLIDPIFEYGQPPNYVTVDGCEINWNLYMDTIPDLPPALADRKCIGEKKTYRLIPYGAAKVHMSDLPTIKL